MILGIIKDGVRSAFVRIVRIIVYIALSILGIYIFNLITSSKASALVYKGDLWNPMNQYTVTGSLASKTQSVINFDINGNAVYADQVPYDTLVFKFNSMYFKTNDTQYSNGNTTNAGATYVCEEWTLSGSKYYCSSMSLERPNSQEVTSATITGVNTGNIYIQSAIYYNDNVNSKNLCYFTSELQDMFVCPLSKNGTKKITDFEIIIQNGGYDTLEYNIELSGLKYYFNYDNTEVVTTTQQIVQQQTITQTYITNTDITGSQTSSDTKLNGLSSQFNDALNGWGGQWSYLTHIVLEPINVILYAFDGSTTCSPIRLNIPYLNDGQYIDLPCMSSIYGSFFSTFISLFVTIIGGLYAYRTIMYIIRTIKEVLDAENDKIEVIDL